MSLRNCPQVCKPRACFCKLKPVKSNYDPTLCEERENNGIAGFYDDLDGRNEFLYQSLITMIDFDILPLI